MTFTGRRYSANEPDPYAQINPRTGQLEGEIPYIPRSTEKPRKPHLFIRAGVWLASYGLQLGTGSNVKSALVSLRVLRYGK